MGWAGGHCTSLALGDVAVMRTLLEFGRVELNSLDRPSDTQLSLAASAGHLSTVEFLLSLGETQTNFLELGSISPF